MNIALDSKFKPKEAYAEKPRTELIDGKILKMASPRTEHGDVSGRILRSFFEYFEDKECRVFFEQDIHLDDRNIFKPDIAVICDLSILRDGKILGSPDLVVEVLSLSTQKNDRGRKKETYARHGVREYWLVDIRNFTVEIYLPINSIFFLHESYIILSKYELETLTAEELKEFPLKFNSVIFDDMQLDLRDVFKYILQQDERSD